MVEMHADCCPSTSVVECNKDFERSCGGSGNKGEIKNKNNKRMHM